MPSSCLLYFGTLPSLRARSPPSRVFDLDHVRPQQGQVQGGERPREHVGQVEHADAFEQFHTGLSFGNRRSSRTSGSGRAARGRRSRPPAGPRRPAHPAGYPCAVPCAGRYGPGPPCHVAGRDFGKRTAAQPAEGGLEVGHAALQGGIAVRQPQPVGIVEVAGQLHLRDPASGWRRTAPRPAPGAHGRPYPPG